MLWPSSSRSLLSARLPLTRSSPLRTMRWMWENDRPGKRASRKRSTRMLFSSAVTTTVWTLVGSGGGSTTVLAGSSANGAGLGARGAAAANRGAGLPPGRCAFDRSCGRSACEPRYGRAPFGRSPAARDFASGLLMRRLMPFFQIFATLIDTHGVAQGSDLLTLSRFRQDAIHKAAANSSRTADWCQTNAQDATPYRR